MRQQIFLNYFGYAVAGRGKLVAAGIIGAAAVPTIAGINGAAGTPTAAGIIGAAHPASLPVLETPRSTGSIGRCAGLELGTTPNTGRGLLASAQPRGVLTVESKGDPGSRDSQV